MWWTVVALAGTGWLQPPPEIAAVLEAPEIPNVSVNPTRDALLLLTPVRYPPIADKAAPMAKLAGIRVDPRIHGLHGLPGATDPVVVGIADGVERPLPLPADLRVLDVVWSADGERFALSVRHPDHVGLWVGDLAGRLEEIDGVRLNPLLGSELRWTRDQHHLLVKVVPGGREPPPAPGPPEGPLIKEAGGGGTAASTYEARDLLQGPYDEALFSWYAESQLAEVDPETEKVVPIGLPGPLATVAPSPDGRYLLVTRLVPPWSSTTAWYRFARVAEVWTPGGELVREVARLPVEDSVPAQGVPEGPRDLGWRQSAPATLAWVEALDGGNPANKAEHRDRLVLLPAPFGGAPREVFRAAHRIEAVWWGAKGLALVQHHERERRWRHVWVLDVDRGRARPWFDLSANDRYADPGVPLMRLGSNGAWLLDQDGDDLFFVGDGGTPTGDRPFLDRRPLVGEPTRLFRSAEDAYERPLARLDAKTWLVRRESPTVVPNVWVAGATDRQITRFVDPTPQIRQVQKRLVTFARADGTPLSFTLYLPPGYREGTRLPTVLYAYPREFSDPATAGQVAGSDKTFDRFVGPTHLFFALHGYAVLHNTTMPVIGEPETAYDRFVPELVANAEAAIAEAVRLGVTDPERVGAMGHSHGGLMTATLLAHTDLFRAGIARSGAYNHTIRPFGFQNERRTFWEAPATYVDLSPVTHAPGIDAPLLIVHGAIDENPGTIPFQSERLFEAIRGTGGTARLVMLPFEGHGYTARESVAHVVAEQLAWFDRFVRDAAAR